MFVRTFCASVIVMPEEKKIVRIRLDLEGSDAKKFRYIKSYRGIKNNTELTRLIINEEYMRIGGKPLL